MQGYTQASQNSIRFDGPLEASLVKQAQMYAAPAR
jgi:hypothetical protein